METTTHLAAQIVAAYLSNHTVPPASIAPLVNLTHGTLRDLLAPPPPEPVALVRPCSIKASVQPDYLVCMEDGLRLKSMKRHLAILGLTPQEYRLKWGLPPNYPMVAPNYAAQRSELAKAHRLGVRTGGGRPSPKKKAVRR